MIVVRARCESEELLMFRSLNLRMILSGKDANYYSNLEKGFEGECKFDKLVAQSLSDDWLAVNDLLLEYNNTMFQIDSLLSGHNTIFVNDVKFYDGDYYMKDGKWYTASGNEVSDPLDQLKRCESLLRRLLQNLGFTIPIESRLVFNNPEFYLYQAPPNLPMIFFPQLSRYMNQLKTKTGKLNDRHFEITQKLVSLHIKKAPVRRIPDYSYEQLKKGIACCCRRGFMKVINRETLICSECGCKETIEAAVLRSVAEFTLLFPDRKIKTIVIHEWCGIIPSLKTIRRILEKNFKPLGYTKATYYVEHDENL